MSDTVPRPPTSKGRRTTFIVLTVLFGLGLGVAGFAFLGLVAAWFSTGGEREVHIVHDIAWGVVGGLLVAIPFLIQAVNPERKPAVMLGAILGVLGLLLGYGLGGVVVFLPLPLVVVGLLWWLHPAREDVIPKGRRPQMVMAALAILAAIPLFMYALDQAAIQRACPPAGDQHCEEFHFAGMAALAYALPLVALGASFLTRGWRIVAWLAGAASVVFGLSGLLFPDNLSSIGSSWGWVSIAGGVVFVALAEWVGRSGQAQRAGST